MLNIPIHEVLQWTYLLSWIFSILLCSFKQTFLETESVSIIIYKKMNYSHFDWTYIVSILLHRCHSRETYTKTGLIA